MLKISSAAVDSRLLTKALISSALNILAQDGGEGDLVHVRLQESASVEPGAAALSWMEQISRDHNRDHAHCWISRRSLF